MVVFFLFGLVAIVISFFILYFSFKKLKGIPKIIGLVIGYVLLFFAGIGVYLGVVIS
ncbi:MAG: hypothetical protein K0R18_1397 [Bacillales bacterium]|jgi:hypothetical protein|nr:hypothetical protein [Bacillales bacterium]